MKFTKVKGTRDFYPPEMAVRNWLTQGWRTVSQRNGFLEYDGPTFEYLDLYTVKSGAEIVSELYSFEDRGGRQLALRPEMTPTLARMIAARAHSLPKPIKWFCVPNFFRAERQQRGRLREFFQWNVDIVGTADEADAVADAECIFVAIDFLRDIGLTPSEVEMRISSREVLAQLLAELDIPAEQHPGVYAVLDKRDKDADFSALLDGLQLGAERSEALKKLGAARGREGLRALEQMLPGNQPDDSPLGRLRRVLNLLSDMQVGAFCVFDPGIVRGLAYYTGVVFEAFSKGTLKRALCGGGRYGNLLAEMGGGQLSGVGFGMGDVIVLDQLAEFGLLAVSDPAVDCYVVSENAEDIGTTLKIVSTVRSGAGHSCNYSYKRLSLKKQMQQAAQQNVRYVVFVADRLSLKHMSSGRQENFQTTSLETSEDTEQFLREYRALIKKLDGS